MLSTMKMRLFSLSCAALLFTGAAGLRAQSADATAASDDDKKFVTAALKGGMAEVKMGQMASDAGKSEDVKMFGAKMVADHTKLGDQMKGVAGQIGVTPPTMMTAKDGAVEAKLKMLSGDDFDKAYISAMVKDHENDLAAFNKEIASGTSPAVKDAAMAGKKVITMHLRMIKKMAADHQVAMEWTGAAGSSGQ